MFREIKRVLDGMTLQDLEGSGTVKTVKNELAKNEYGVEGICFSPGDVVVDAGANVGVFSCYLARKHPDIKIYAFEPILPTFTMLVRNINANGLTNIYPFCAAVWSHVGKVSLGFAPEHSGGSSVYLPNLSQQPCLAITMREVFELVGWTKRIRLLKMDIEGAEHAVIKYMSSLWPRIDCLAAELHENDYMIDNFGFTNAKTTEVLHRHLRPEQIIALNYIKM